MASNSAGIGGLLPPQTTSVANYILTTDGQTASWEVSSASLPSQGGNSGKYLTTDGSVASWASVVALPTQTGHSGEFLTTDGTTASWSAGLGGVTTMAAVGSSPSANGASISGATLTLQPADSTHPGVVDTTANQVLGTGAKIIDGLYIAKHFSMPGIARGPLDADLMIVSDGATCSLNAVTTLAMNVNLVVVATITATSLDLTGMGAGGSIKLKSPGGTTYTATIADGGTWSIA